MSGHLGIGFPIITLLLSKIAIVLGVLGVALASNDLTLIPQIKQQTEQLGVLGAIYRYFPEDKVDTALRIASTESRLNPLAKNPSSSASGVFQITKGTKADFCPDADLFDAEENVKCAATIHEKTGWERWDASKSSWSKK